MMQPPTCYGLRVRTTADAQVIFHAISMNLLSMVARRLDNDERRAISSGCVYVWEERGSNAGSNGLGIERWTDSIRWGPSRVRDDFLLYQELRAPSPTEVDMTSDSDTATSALYRARGPLCKQTYSVFVETPRGRRKWHLIAYYTQENSSQLHTIANHPLYPQLAKLEVPRGMYVGARLPKPARRNSSPERGLRDPEPHFPIPSRRPPSGAAVLAPLAYLTTRAPKPRHILDQMALDSLPIDLTLNNGFSRMSRVSW